MKKFLLTSFIIICVFVVNAQIKFVYCEIVGTSNLGGNKVTVEIDFGQQTKFMSDHRLVDETGKVIKFNSMVDAMNWMGKDGWEFVQAYGITSASGSRNVYHFLLKKDISQLSQEERDQIFNNLKIKKQ